MGEKTAEQLHRLGLRTVGDIAHTPLATLQRAVGPAHGHASCTSSPGARTARMVTARRGAEEEPDKSIGADETFGRDTDDPEVVLRELLRLSAKVGARMRAAAGGRAHRDAEGPVRRLHHDHPVPDPRGGHRRDPGDPRDRDAGCSGRSGCSGPGSGWSGSGWRGWCPAPAVYRQLVLGARDHGWAEADQAVDRAVSRFGAAAVQPASLLHRGAGRSTVA